MATQYLRDCLSDYGLADLGYTRCSFTWHNKRENDENIQVRLDMATCNSNCMSMYPATNVENLTTIESDHMAILIRVMVTAPHAWPSVARLF